VNDNFCQISKYSREELIGQDHRIVKSGSHSRNLFVNCGQLLVKERFGGEIENRKKDGSLYWVDTVVPFLNDKGKPYQYIAIRSDITEKTI
jgi:PAS domain S-box-containing protein